MNVTAEKDVGKVKNYNGCSYCIKWGRIEAGWWERACQGFREGFKPG
jgi:hypothetical protein